MAQSQLHAAPPSQAGFSVRAIAGDVLHIWQKPVDAATPSQVLLHGAKGGGQHLVGPPSAGYQLSVHTFPSTDDISVAWNEADTLVSVCYIYNPQTVFERGIHVLWSTEQTRPSKTRYRLHLAPPFGWMNDPTGLTEINGHAHAFYQHYPHSHHWGTMHWGHAMSGNLVDWTHLPVFLHPRSFLLADGAKKGGAFSGSAVARNDGTLRVFHTDREDGRLPNQEWQMTAASNDLLAASISETILNSYPPIQGFGPDLRDPYVFFGQDGKWKMLLGGADATAALVLLYESEDCDVADSWRFVGVLHREHLEQAVPAECPCLVALDGEGEGLSVLIFGMIGQQTPVNGRLNPSLAIVGRFDGKSFEEIARRELDFVGDCYAFQSFLYQSRPVGFAWGANWANVRRSKDFASSLTFARRLIWKDNKLLMPPVETTVELRKLRLAGSARELLQGVALPDGLAEINITLSGKEAFQVTFSHPEIPMTLAYDGGVLELQGDWVKLRSRGVEHMVETAPPQELRIFIDVGIVEIYVDGGRLCGTKRLDSDFPISAVRLQASPGTAASAEVWQLRPHAGAAQ